MQRCEKVAELKLDYDFQLRRFKGEKFAEKRDAIIAERDAAIQKLTSEMDNLKTAKINEVKARFQI